MGFDTGNISFRVFYLPTPLPANHIERLAAHAAPSLEALGPEHISGWVTGRHLLDRHITEETATIGAYLRVTLMKAEKKIPAPLLRAEVTMEADGLEQLPRPERGRIKKEITARLLPDMPPHLQGIPISARKTGDAILTGALSEKQMDALCIALKHTLDIDAVPMTPETAALRRRKTSVADLPPTSFSPNCPDDEVNPAIGLDFLTWLWFFSEARRGLLETAEGAFSIQVQGPLTFFMEGDGAHEAKLKNGEPLLSGEAKTALMSGKKLSQACVVLAKDQEEWKVELDASEFVFRGLTLPKPEPVDKISRYHDRMRSINTFLTGFLSLYDLFLDERLDSARWSEARSEIHRWVTSREVR
jgi:hypothetical protein